MQFATGGYATEWPSSGGLTVLVALIRFTGQIVVPVGLIAAIALGVRELSSPE